MRIKKSILPLFVAVLCFWSADLFAQVGYNNPNPHPSSIVDMQANDKGLLIPRMTSSERSAMTVSSTTPAEGLLVFDTDVNRIFYWDDNVAAWRAVNFADVTQIGNDEFVTIDGSLILNNGMQVNGQMQVNNDIQLNGTLNTDSISVNATNGNGVVPTGAIIMWYGNINNIPQGYALCDGSSGTPDLRNRFVVGSGGSYATGDFGGANSVTLTVNQMPSHNHSINDPGHSHDYMDKVSVNERSDNANDRDVGDDIKNDNQRVTDPSTTGISINNEGGGQPHENRPPYYALAYIMKL